MQETALHWFDLGTGDENSFVAFKEMQKTPLSYNAEKEATLEYHILLIEKCKRGIHVLRCLSGAD